MSYTLDFSIALGSSQVGLTLEAQLVDTAGAGVGAAIGTGFVEHGLGNYQWHTTAIPDGHRGGVKFQVSGGGTLKAFAAINPEEAENLPVKQTGDAFVRLGAPAGASVSADIAAIEAQTDDIGAAGAGLTAIPAPANLDVAVSTRLAAVGYTAPDNAGIAVIQAAVDTEVAAIKVNTDKVGTAMELDGAVYRFTTNALEQAPGGGGGGPVGPGAISHPVTVTEPDLITPIDGVAVWVTTDAAGTNTIAGTLYTDALGRINGTIGFMLNAGTYYLWRERSGWNFSNPQSFVVV